MAKKITFKDSNQEVVYPKTIASQVVDLADVAKTGSYNDLGNKPELFSGDYNDLTNKPAIPSIEGLATEAALAALETKVDSQAVVVKDNFDFSTDFDGLGSGTYAVTNAVNSPFDDENGMLKVVETKSGMFIHTWNGKNNTAFREFGEFNPLEANIDALQVNGVTVNTALSDDYNEQGVKFTYEQKDTENFNSGKIMWVYPGGTYTLSGVLINCQIRVGYMPDWCVANEFKSGTFDTQVDSNGTTTIILNNFYHKVDRELVYDSTNEDSWSKAFEAWSPLIMSEIAGKTNRRGKLVIQLADNSKNYIVRKCTPTMETANNKWGVIYSEQDLDIIGNGYLGIADGADKDHLLGCHAIKAKGMLKIHNQPHIVGRAYHDLIHGNDGLYIDGGYFQALYCNDVLGTDTSLGDQAIGKIRLYNGVFDIRECYGTFVQADDVIVYPGVKVSFKEIGEGLWLQCAPGFYKGEISKKGQVSNFGIVDYTTHEFRLYTLPKKKKLDAAAFTKLVEETSETSVKIIFNGSEQDITVSRVTIDMPGIIVYDGMGLTPDADYIYKESNRNTHVESLVNSAPTPDGGWNYNLIFAPTSTETTIENELTVAEAAALLNGHTNDLADADFDAIDYQYSGRASGGIWNIGVTEQKLTEYKNKVDYLFTCVKGMIVPPKEVGVDSVVSASYDVDNDAYTTDGVENTRTDEFINNGGEIAAGAVINGQTVISKIKTGASMYTSKTGLEPTINLHVGEAILVNGLLLPADTTNFAMKWSVVGASEWTVIARLVTEDTMGCYIRALQPGAEDIVISAKALDKDNGKVKIKIHFVVEA